MLCHADGLTRNAATPGHASSAARGLLPPRGVSAKLAVFAEVELLDFCAVKARPRARWQHARAAQAPAQCHRRSASC
jgi:hypothetical protein